MSKPAVVVHGGAWSSLDETCEDHLRGVRRSANAAWEILRRGGSALDACEAAVMVMEDDEHFDAGRGSFLTRDGSVQMDALIMEGRGLRAGGVGCVERIRNPIQAARKVLEESPHVYLVARGAEAFAESQGIVLCRNEDLIVPREVERWKRAQEQSPSLTGSGTDSHDTVGAVALDREGNLVAATSTGGTLNKMPGRVGDSSLVGCGCYADNESAAVSVTGWGEPIMRLVLGKWAVDRVRAGIAPRQAAQEALAYLERRLNGHGGMILLDAQGNIGVAHSTARMPWALRTEALESSGLEIR